MSNINEHILRIVGSHPLSGPLDASHYARIQTEIAIESVEKKDLHDGTFDMIYKAKATAAVDAEQLGKVVRGKPPKQSQSKKLRAKVYGRGYEESVADSERHYDDFMEKLLSNFDVVYSMLKNKL